LVSVALPPAVPMKTFFAPAGRAGGRDRRDRRIVDDDETGERGAADQAVHTGT
jgi:hypothetical protein